MSDVGNLVAKLTLDSTGFETGVSKLAGSAEKVVGGVATAVAGIATASAVAVGKMVKDAVQHYADYEQLVGGVETLFKQSAGIIEDYAMQAYKTAGIGANEYMETVTSFSASMIQSLGGDTEKAAELSNQAIIDMSDNANKMGTSMESIQNAYQGFAKQNYTMLDNLKLGYGGTKEEMERLLVDAEKLDSTFSIVHEQVKQKNGEMKETLVYNFADIVEAIHIVQTEMGITGTTAKEASETVSGSWGMVKASWQDLMTSVAGGGKGMVDAIGAFTESCITFAGNVIPVIQEALYGIGDLITGLAPSIISAIPELANGVLPSFIEAVMTITDAIIQVFPQIIMTLYDSAIALVPRLVDSIENLLEVLMTQGVPLLLNLALDIIIALGESLNTNLPKLMPALISMVQYMVEIVFQHLGEIIELGLTIILTLAEALMDNLDQIMFVVTEIIVGIVGTFVMHLPEFLELGVKIVIKIAEGILLAIPRLLVATAKLFGIIKDTGEEASSGMASIESNVSQTTSKVNSSLSSMKSSMKSAEGSVSGSASKISGTAESAESSVKTTTNRITDSMGRTVLRTVDDSGKIYHEMTKLADGGLEVIENGQRKIIDSSGRTVARYDAVTGKLISSSNNTQSAVDSAMSSVSTSAEKAASSVESSVNRINSALGNIQGGNININARAKGGDIKAGNAYITGELGPELIIPKTSGHVFTAEETADIFSGAGHGEVINITIAGDVYDDARSMKRKLKSAMLDVLQEQMAYG